jgi:small subunit ribosomal protein S16
MRMGKKKQPTYRVVAADRRSPRDGRFIEIVGTYNPRQEPSEIRIDNAKAVGWLREGAQPSDRVRKLLEISGAWAAYTSGRTREELEAEQAAAAAEAEGPDTAPEPEHATVGAEPSGSKAAGDLASEAAGVEA